MTVKELYEKDFFCDFLEITIRENGNGKWLYQYRIGENVTNAVYDDLFINGKWKRFERCVVPPNRTERRTPNNLKGVLIPKKPEKALKEVGDLEVYGFRISHLFCEVEHRGKSDYHGLDIECYPKGWKQPEPKEEQKQEDDGQISLF